VVFYILRRPNSYGNDPRGLYDQDSRTVDYSTRQLGRLYQQATKSTKEYKGFI
jgi:hypothetical protein